MVSHRLHKQIAVAPCGTKWPGVTNSEQTPRQTPIVDSPGCVPDQRQSPSMGVVRRGRTPRPFSWACLIVDREWYCGHPLLLREAAGDPFNEGNKLAGGEVLPGASVIEQPRPSNA